jgi:hypothetical protein
MCSGPVSGASTSADASSTQARRRTPSPIAQVSGWRAASATARAAAVSRAPGPPTSTTSQPCSSTSASATRAQRSGGQSLAATAEAGTRAARGRPLRSAIHACCARRSSLVK